MNESEIETRLTQLQSDWPADPQFVEQVLSRLKGTPPHSPVVVPSNRRKMRWILATTVAALVCLGLTCFVDNPSQQTLAEQVKAAMKNVDSVHTRWEVSLEDGQWITVDESWFARGQGFRFQSPNQVRLDTGEHLWEHQIGSQTVTRSQSRNTDDILERMVDSYQSFHLSEMKRYPDGDRNNKGTTLECYRRTFESEITLDKSHQQEDVRMDVFVADSLVHSSETHRKRDGVWLPWMRGVIEYGQQAPVGTFDPNFGPMVKIVDTDELFAQTVDLQKAIHVEERQGLIYAIHQLKRLDHGRLLLLTSVRGTDETNRRFPSKERRMIQPGLFIGSLVGGHELDTQGDGYFQIPLAGVSHQGVSLKWWIQIPRGAKSNWFENSDGFSKIHLGMSPEDDYRRHLQKEKVKVHLSWEIEPKVDTPETIPTLQQATAEVYADLKSLLLPRHYLDLGTDEDYAEPTEKIGDLDDTTAEQFAEYVQKHIHWWEWEDLKCEDDDGAYVATTEVDARYYDVIDDEKLLLGFSDHTEIEVMLLRGTRITDQGMKWLAKLKNLTHLDVSETAITDVGLEPLQQLTQLTQIDVRKTQVTSAGIDRLKKALPNLVFVTEDETEE